MGDAVSIYDSLDVYWRCFCIIRSGQGVKGGYIDRQNTRGRGDRGGWVDGGWIQIFSALYACLPVLRNVWSAMLYMAMRIWSLDVCRDAVLCLCCVVCSSNQNRCFVYVAVHSPMANGLEHKGTLHEHAMWLCHRRTPRRHTATVAIEEG